MCHRAIWRNGSSWCDVAMPLVLAILILPARLVALPSSLVSSQALVSAGGGVGRWQLNLRTNYTINKRASAFSALLFANNILLLSQHQQHNFRLLPRSARSSAGRRPSALRTMDCDSFGEHDRRSRMGAATHYPTGHFVCGGLIRNQVFSWRSTRRTPPFARECPRLGGSGGVTNNQGEDGGSVEEASFGTLPGKKDNNADNGEDGRNSSDPDKGVGAEAADGYKVEPIIELPVDGTLLLQLFPVVLIGVLGVLFTGLVQLEASRFDAGVVGQGGGGGEEGVVVVKDLRQSDSK